MDGLEKDIYEELFAFIHNKAFGISHAGSIESQAETLTQRIMHYVDHHMGEENQIRELPCDVELMEDQS